MPPTLKYTHPEKKKILFKNADVFEFSRMQDNVVIHFYIYICFQILITGRNKHRGSYKPDQEGIQAAPHSGPRKGDGRRETEAVLLVP